MGSKKTEKTFDTNSANDKSQEGNAKEGKREGLLFNGADNTTKDVCHRYEKRSKIVFVERELSASDIWKVYLKWCIADK